MRPGSAGVGQAIVVSAEYGTLCFGNQQPMYEEFQAHVDALRPKLNQPLSMSGVKPSQLPKQMPKAGIYLLSENGQYLYVGRSNDIRDRIRKHTRPGATHRTAAFAFRLARHATGQLIPSYKKGEGSREALMSNPSFLKAFDEAKARISVKDLHYVEEADPVRQCLLEVYVAVVLKAKHNDFDNH